MSEVIDSLWPFIASFTLPINQHLCINMIDFVQLSLWMWAAHQVSSDILTIERNPTFFLGVTNWICPHLRRPTSVGSAGVGRARLCWSRNRSEPRSKLQRRRKSAPDHRLVQTSTDHLHVRWHPQVLVSYSSRSGRVHLPGYQPVGH